MLKITISLFILIALIGTNMSPYCTYLGFEINKKYIVENLCENRMRPQMHCNGKCYLMKKIKQAEQNEKKQDQQRLLKALELNFIVRPLRVIFSPVVETSELKRKFYACCFLYLSQYANGIFHPPQ